MMRKGDSSVADTLLHKSFGFILIELMITVAIISILASIAIPLYYSYVYKTAKSEAYTNIAAIYDMEMAYTFENSTYITAAWAPATIAGTQKIPWQTGNYLDNLGFSPNGDVYYRYGVAVGATWENAPTNSSSVPETANIDIIIQAEGDVDGDGATSQYYTTDETRTIIPNTSNY